MPLVENTLDMELLSPTETSRTAAGENQRPPLYATDQEYVPPNGGYGWVCVICVFLINAHTWGLNFAYGIFLDFFLTEKLYPGASAFDYALIGGLSTSMSLLISPVINTSSRLLGTHPTLLIGLALETAAFIGASFATRVWHLYLSQGVCFGWGLGFLYVGSSNIVPQWFSSKRSLANGTSAAGAPFGGLIYSLAISSLLERSGPPFTFRILAGCGFVANLLAIVLVKDRNNTQKPNHAAFNYCLFKRIEIWLLIGWGCLSELGYTVLLYSLPNYARSVGFSSHQGAILGALLNLGILIGRPLTGYVSDKLGRINIATVTTGLCGIFCLLLWIFARGIGLLYLFALLSGMVCGTFWATVAPIGAEVAGLSELPSTLSIIFFVMVLPTTFAEPIGLKLRRSTGNIYLDAQIFVGFMFIGAALCNLFLRSWKIDKVEQEAIAKREHDQDGHEHSHSRTIYQMPSSFVKRRGKAVTRFFCLERV